MPPLVPALTARDLFELWLDDTADPLDLLERAAARGDVVHIPFGGDDAFLLSNPRTVIEVLTGDAARRDPAWIETIAGTLGTGLLANEGPDWEEHRRAVHSALLRSRSRLCTIATDQAAMHFSTWAPGDKRDLAHELAKTHWSLIWTWLLGAPVPEPPPYDLTHDAWLGVRENLGTLTVAAPPGTVAAALREAGLGGAALVDETLTLLFAGRDTTTAALQWVSAALSVAPDEQAYLRAATPPDAAAAMGRAVREALRLWPPTPFITRLLTRPLPIEGGDLPAGARVVLSPWVTHRDPRVFEDPLRFAPERWHMAQSGCYFPFGAGPRMCVGSATALHETAAVTSVLVDRFQFTCAGPAPRARWRGTLVPEGGLHVILESPR